MPRTHLIHDVTISHAGLTPYHDSHAGVILSRKTGMIDAIILTEERHPKVACARVFGVVIDDRHVRETAIGSLVLPAGKANYMLPAL